MQSARPFRAAIMRAVHADIRHSIWQELCDRVREVCPEFPGTGDAVHWSIVNPVTTEPASRTLARFQATVDELDTRISYLMASLSARHTDAGAQRRTP